jgi:hypothetical protein
MALTVQALSTTNVKGIAWTGGNGTLTVYRVPSGTTTQTSLGTVVFTGQTAYTVNPVGGPTSMAVGDVLQLVATPVDGTIADVGISIQRRKMM